MLSLVPKRHASCRCTTTLYETLRRTALSSLPQNPAPEPSAPRALIQNTSLRCDWFSCHLPDSGQCFQNLQWSGARLQMQAKHFAVQQLALVFQAKENGHFNKKRKVKQMCVYTQKKRYICKYFWKYGRVTGSERTRV